MIPQGWKIERKTDLFRAIHITAPNGYTAAVTKLSRNPENVLYMLADDLLKAEEAARGVKGTPLVPCPVCGGEAVHAQDVLARTTIAPVVTECPLCLNDASVGQHGVGRCIVAGALGVPEVQPQQGEKR